MTFKLQKLRGMKDLLPDDFAKHYYIEQLAKSTGELYGYKPVSIPILEYTNIFDRTLGEASDIVSKEIYSFFDKSNNSIALRPEFTAGIMRMVLTNPLPSFTPAKFFTTGPLFRYDRPQKGRQRQFQQINFEYIHAEGAYSDAETISLAVHILKELNILNKVKLELNSLGCLTSQNNYRLALQNYFERYVADLSNESKIRLVKNPLRILDSKDKKDQEINSSAPVITDFYSNEAQKYFDEVKNYLELLGIQYIVNNKLVRGLDYYRHTIFEFTTNANEPKTNKPKTNESGELGAQNTVLAGGRYDALAALMGHNSEIPAIGFAAGVERLVMMLPEFNYPEKRPVIILPISEEAISYSINLISKLRYNGLYTIMDSRGKMQKRLQRAIDSAASHVIFIGSEEIAADQYRLKDLDNKTESLVDLAYLLTIKQLR